MDTVNVKDYGVTAENDEEAIREAMRVAQETGLPLVLPPDVRIPSVSTLPASDALFDAIARQIRDRLGIKEW